jgi:L-iditol 2-dehydrogenase
VFRDLLLFVSYKIAADRHQVGDRVAMEVGVYCKTCKFCKIGRYNLCSNMRFASSAKTFPHLDGTLREVMTFPAELLHK